ncbi:enoyl-CoA hydratase/isomerase family protein [Thermoanaerobacterium sp. DL9XJH110]|uniref:enoyl-CoA hydratase/isomerase family protein n=1 Tax=Thermoanaerobacterium sp. DL9XJH110 TaxID=3386643 RepID=UPI003BB77168
MDYQLLLYKEEDRAAYITINRPEVRNALSNRMVEELEDAVYRIEKNEDLRAAVVTGAGDRAFMSGADIKELVERDAIIGRRHTRQRQELFSRIENLNIPVIAAVNGYAIGAGLELSLACTFRIASENAGFAASEVKLGIIPGAGGTQRLAKLVGKAKALEMILLGDMIDAQEAFRIGLVNKVVPQDKLMEEVAEWVKKIKALPKLAIQYAKEAINRGANLGLDQGLAHESYLFALACTTHDKKEGVAAFLEKRPPNFTGR